MLSNEISHCMIYLKKWVNDDVSKNRRFNVSFHDGKWHFRMSSDEASEPYDGSNVSLLDLVDGTINRWEEDGNHFPDIDPFA